MSDRAVINAFDKMMASAKAASAPPAPPAPTNEDPIYTAVVYRRWLEHVDQAEPLWHTPYFGQAVRDLPTPLAVAESRWKEEDQQAKREDKEVGLIAVLDCFGPDAMDSVVLEHRTGPRSVVQKWADQREIELIAEAGGTLRDMDQRLTQTLNIAKGGKGVDWWANTEALCTKFFNRFKTEMEKYVADNGHSRVPCTYVDPVTKYNLGMTLVSFRRGYMLKNKPDRSQREKWAESLPGWAWSMHDAEFEAFQAEMEEYVKLNGTSRVPKKYVNPVTNYKLGGALSNFRHHNKPDENACKDDRQCWAEGLPKWTWNLWDEAFQKFKMELETYVKLNNTSRVPTRYVNPVTKYNLGTRLSNFRMGKMRTKSDTRAEREAWAEALPEWAWSLRKKKAKPVAESSSKKQRVAYDSDDG